MPRQIIQNLDNLEKEMRAVARGEKTPQEHAGRPSFNSIEALVWILTPENRRLLSIIRDCHPKSIAELADFSGRAASNLTRTLAKLEAAGLIRMETVGRRKTPRTTVHKLKLEIDPYSENDQLELVDCAD